VRKGSTKKVATTPFSALSSPLIVEFRDICAESTEIMVEEPVTCVVVVSQVTENIVAEMLPETESNEVSSEGDDIDCSVPIVEPWIASAAATLQVSYMQYYHLYCH
jgi:hypothetical protein